MMSCLELANVLHGFMLASAKSLTDPVQQASAKFPPHLVMALGSMLINDSQVVTRNPYGIILCNYLGFYPRSHNDKHTSRRLYYYFSHVAP